MPVRSPKSATWLASAGTRPWSSSAVGRSVRASVNSSSIAWVASVWISLSSERSPGGTSWPAACRRSRIAVRAWLTSSCRSWAMRARSSSCARMTARPPSTRSSSRRVSMRLKSAVRRWISRGAVWWALARWPGEARSTRSIVWIRRSSGASRRLSRIVFSSTALTTASAISSSAGSPRRRRPSRARASAATIAVAATRPVLTARTWERRVRVRICCTLYRQLRLR